MTGWAQCVQIMVQGGGLACRDELLRAGLSERTLRRRLASGLLVPMNVRVVALPGTPTDLATRTRAAALARPDAIPTGPSAGVLLGSGPWDVLPRTDVPWLVGRDDRVIPARYVRHPGLQTVRRGGLVVAHPSAAVVDLLRFLDPEQAVAVGRAALQQRVVDLELLITAHARLAQLWGATQLGRIIGELADGTHSQAEHDLVALLRAAGLTGWSANYPIVAAGRRYYVDVAFAGARLAIEVDGWAYHSDAMAFQRDRRRQNDLVAAGWTVLRFTWADITQRPEYVLARITDHLARHSIA